MKRLLYLATAVQTNFLYQEAPTGEIEADETFRNSDLYMIGDSLTVGMAGALPGVRSDAVEGRSVRDMPAAMDRALNATPRPEVISIMGGTNDGGDINQIRSAYSTMLAAARAAGVRVIVATLPPLRGRSLTEANAYIRGLASSDVTVVELESIPLGNDNVHFSGYGAPANEILNTARTLSVGHEANTVEALLRGEIDPNAPITDAAIEAAAEHMARAIPGNLDLARLLDDALGVVGEINDDAAIATLTETVDELVATEAELDELAALSEEDVTRMQNITNLEFLEIPMSERLRYITTENVTAPEVAEGRVNSLTFTFTFGDQPQNDDLWRNTTAGQVMPPEVRSVTSGGAVYSRHENALSGEFYNEAGTRLRIYDQTNLSSIETGDVSEIQARVDQQLAEFETNEEGESRTEGEMLVARMAAERGVQPEFVMAAFVEQDNEIETEDLGISGEQALTLGYRAQVENFLTDIGRAEDFFNQRFSDEDTREADRLRPNFAAFFLGVRHEDSETNDILTASGYSSAEITAAESYRAASQEFGSAEAMNFNFEYAGEVPEAHMQAAANLIASFEGFSATAYWDVNAYRIGYGTDTIIGPNGERTSVTASTRITQAQAVASLAPNIEEHIGPLANQIDITSLSPNQFAVLASIAYNFGPYKFNQPSGRAILAAIRAGDDNRAANLIAHLSDSQPILISRRQREARLFLSA